MPELEVERAMDLMALVRSGDELVNTHYDSDYVVTRAVVEGLNESVAVDWDSVEAEGTPWLQDVLGGLNLVLGIGLAAVEAKLPRD